MDISIKDRFKRAWNVFRDKSSYNYGSLGEGSYYRPDKIYRANGKDNSLITSVFNKIAIDVASLKFMHVRLDENDRFSEVIDDSLNKCLTVSSNKDQTPSSFFMDAVISLLQEGVIAIVPVDTDTDPDTSGGYTIYSLRVGKITQWFPDKVEVELYNDTTGKMEKIMVSKSFTAIVESPLYDVINRHNSTIQRLIHKLALLDIVDDNIGSNKLDLIIQLPYSVRSELKKKQAEERRESIIDQLTKSKYGIAYIDATEHVTQLNRPVENSLLENIKYLMDLFYSQTGINQAVMDGTADEATMLNYYNRTIEPIVRRIVEEMQRKFLTQTGRTQRQSIIAIRDPFKLVTLDHLAQSIEIFTRNEVLSSNDSRAIMGYRPSKEQGADDLRNKNLKIKDTTYNNSSKVNEEKEDKNQNE